jgi:hypothetical protein
MDVIENYLIRSIDNKTAFDAFSILKFTIKIIPAYKIKVNLVILGIQVSLCSAMTDIFKR